MWLVSWTSKPKFQIYVESTTIEAFIKGLDPLSKLYTMILDYEPQTLDEVLTMVSREIKLEEDPARISTLRRKSNGKFESRGPKKDKAWFDPYKKYDMHPINNPSGQT